MSLEKFKEKNALEFPLGKLITMIARGHSFYLNHRLEDLNINASQLHTLFEIKCSNGINQDEIAKRCNVDKGSVARSLRKLEDKELIVKEIDEIASVKDIQPSNGRKHCEVTERMINCIDVLVDGPFIESLKDITLDYRGSSNQRILWLKEDKPINSI